MKPKKLTKVLATIGPSSSSPKIIRELIKAGANMFRINFSHIDGEFAKASKIIKSIRDIAKEEKTIISILGDLQGPKIRTGRLKSSPVQLVKGKEIRITTKELDGDEKLVSTTYHDLPKDVKPGDKLMVDDGLLELKVKKVEKDTVVCEIIVGGQLKNFKGMNLPGVKVSSPALSPKDIEDVHFAAKEGLDFLALSFARSVDDVRVLISLLKDNNYNIPIITKIEKPEALAHIDKIIQESYGLMIARGDLGVEMNPAKVPSIQKNLVSKCIKAGKPVIIATQMLDSMQNNPLPTRAEASDVANAVVDGADCLMLSGETAAGKYPVRSVKTMTEIISITEKEILQKNWKDHRQTMKHNEKKQDPMHLVCRAAYRISKDIHAHLIVSITHSGSTAMELSKYRPGVPIIALTEEEYVVRRLNLSWGVMPHLSKKIEMTAKFFDSVIDIIEDSYKPPKDAPVIITVGLPHLSHKSTNTLKIHYYGSSKIM